MQSPRNENEQDERCALRTRYAQVRNWSEAFCQPLEAEDYVVQSMPDVSPTKWHIAHTSWFFETFILKPLLPGYQSLHPQYDYLFNSYYNSIGERHCRPKRGLISRPTVDEVYHYRAYVDEHMDWAIQGMEEAQWREYAPIITLGLHHEQQHQELMVTDIKHVFSENPLCPVYQMASESPPAPNSGGAGEMRWVTFGEGVREIGYDGDGFFFDNEGPRHKEFVPRFFHQYSGDCQFCFCTVPHPSDSQNSGRA